MTVEAPMRFVSLNAWGGQLWENLRDWVPQVGADVLCLQEMIRAPEPSPEWLSYVDPYRRLAQRADLFADISALLPDHQARFAPAAQGPLSGEDGRIYRSEHGLGLWARRDLALAGAFEGYVHGRYRRDGWGAEPVPRAIQMVRVTDPARGKTGIVAQFHGLRDPSGKGDTPERLAQARKAVSLIRQFRRVDEPIILAGDFNLLPVSESFAIFAELGLADLVTGLGITDTRTARYKKPERHANYCLVSANVRVHKFEAPAEPEVSDHRPLILDFEFDG